MEYGFLKRLQARQDFKIEASDDKVLEADTSEKLNADKNAITAFIHKMEAALNELKSTL